MYSSYSKTRIAAFLIPKNISDTISLSHLSTHITESRSVVAFEGINNAYFSISLISH